MNRKVTGIFSSYFEADQALTQLFNEGFAQNDISVIMSETTRDRFLADTKDTKTEKRAEIAENTVDGASIGGVLGALIGGLTAATGFLIPGIGVLVAGPAIAALAGAGAGVSIGSVAGAFSETDYSEDDARRYENEIKQGKAVLVVHAKSDEQVSTAKKVLNDFGVVSKAA